MERSGRRRPPLACWIVDYRHGADGDGNGDTTPSGGDSARRSWASRGFPAPYAMLAGFCGLLTVGTVAAALDGLLPAVGVLAASAVLVAVVSLAAQPGAAPVMAVMGFLTTAGFSGPPYAQLRLSGSRAGLTAAVMFGTALAFAAAGVAFRLLSGRRRLWTMGTPTRRPAGRGVPAPPLAWAIGGRRLLVGILIGAAALPAMTALLVLARGDLSLADELLIYLVVVVVVAVVGGFWPAVLAAVAASLLLNFYFAKPLHTFAIAEPQSLLALLLFVTVAVTVSSVVHLAASRAVQAARSSAEAASLLALAQTVLGGCDTSEAVLDHFTASFGGRAELYELAGGRWVRTAVSGQAPAGDLTAATPIEARPGLALVAAGQRQQVGRRLLDGFAAQAAAALDRDRLRTEAAQAQALAEGNRMRTALLAAVSHDLRTPLASIKASVSSLRQTDVQWTAADESDLLATIEENADRLDTVIGNLLDMSRLQTGSLEPFLRPTAIDEVAPVAVRGLGATSQVEMAVPDGLPLVRTDPGLLERVLANVLANALRHSPAGAPPVVAAHEDGGHVVVEVLDHGRGVPDSLKPRIFEPFQRLDDRDSSAGVGLGLAVARGFVEAMGGSVTAADTAGGGLTIRIVLPVAAKRAGSALPTGPGPARP